MYLRALNIKGFKSFADKTSLKFEPGITVVVGPNGSGKSNITDAVLWVLGEQSPRTLRGSAMEDVIFAGSPERSSSGLAEVTLFLDNSDGVLPIEFSEVSITRRMSRVGESEYLINNSPCRLLDVQDLLMDSGLGKEMYSIVSQGRLEEVLTSKPEERRMLIEEAAGVLKYKRRKERALRKLISMEQNLARAKDVLKEVNRQLQPLERQARKAQDYGELANQLRSVEISLSVKQLQELRRKWNELDSTESSHKEALRDTKSLISKREEEKEHLRVDIEKGQAQLGTLEERKRRLSTCEDRVSSCSTLLAEKEKALTLREQELRQKIEQFEKRLKKREEDSSDLSEKTALTLQRKDALNRRLNDLQVKFEKEKEKGQRLIEELGRLRKQVGEAEADHAKKQEQLRSLEANDNNRRLREDFVRNQISACELRISERVRALMNLKEEQIELSSVCTRLTEKEQALRERTERENQTLGELKSRREEIGKKLAVLQAEQKALDSLRVVLSENSGLEVVREAGFSGVLGVLGELIQVPRKYKKAIEAVLGADLSCLLIDTVEDADRVSSFIQSERIARISMLAASGINRRSKQTSLNKDFIPASVIVRCSASIREAVRSLLEGVFIVPDIKSAFDFLAHQGAPDDPYTLVTEHGEVVQSNGRICVGSQERSCLLPGHEEKKEIEREIKKYLANLKAAEEEFSLELAQNSALSKDMEFLTKELRENDFALQALVAEKKRIEGEVANAKSQRRTLAQELKECISEKETADHAAARLKEEIVGAARDLATLRNRLEQLTHTNEKHFEQRNETEHEMVKCQLEITALEERENYLAKQTGLISEDHAELKMLLDSERGLRQSYERFSRRLAPLNSLFDEILEMVKRLTKEVDARISAEQAFLGELKEKLNLEKAEGSSSSEQVGELQEKIQNTRISKAQLEVQIKSISQKIVEEFEVPLDKAISEYQVDVPPDNLRKKANELKKQIERLGLVNLIAVEEFTELQERQRFLRDQINDLTESEQALEKVAAAIDKKIKDQFLQTFQVVNFNFQSVFSYLFEGGEAELILDDPKDPLNGGISFDVQPAGKRLQKVTLLSGGEAALVALTFLFAIHHTRPSPFYILDEVEPALDSMNLQRFTAFLKAQSTKTQFLIITHQKRTMEVADLLYGVSMNEEGVSSVISQRLAGFEDAKNGRVYAS